MFVFHYAANTVPTPIKECDVISLMIVALHCTKNMYSIIVHAAHEPKTQNSSMEDRNPDNKLDYLVVDFGS